MTDNWSVMEVKPFRGNGYITLPKPLQDKVVFEHSFHGELVYWSIIETGNEEREESEKYVLLSDQEVSEDWSYELEEGNVTEVDRTEITEDNGVRPPAKALDQVHTEIDREGYGGFLATDEMIEDGIDGTRFSYFLPGSQVEELLPDNLGFGYSSDIPEEKLYEAAERLPELR